MDVFFPVMFYSFTRSCTEFIVQIKLKRVTRLSQTTNILAAAAAPPPPPTTATVQHESSFLTNVSNYPKREQ